MKITSRKTHYFIELKVDETETTVYKSNPKEVEDMIFNLLEIADDLASYTGNSLKDHLQFFKNEKIYTQKEIIDTMNETFTKPTTQYVPSFEKRKIDEALSKPFRHR